MADLREEAAEEAMKTSRCLLSKISRQREGISVLQTGNEE